VIGQLGGQYRGVGARHDRGGRGGPLKLLVQGNRIPANGILWAGTRIQMMRCEREDRSGEEEEDRWEKLTT